MAELRAAPPRTPSPKVRMHRSQSFDSPSSRISVTPIDDSPYSKSTGSISITKPLPRYNINALHDAEHATLIHNRVTLQTKMSDDSLMSDASSITSSSSSSAASSPTESLSENGSPFGLFTSGSPVSRSASPSPQPRLAAPSHSTADSTTRPPPPSIISSNLSLAVYQDMSMPMYDPWLVRVVLDFYDVRGFDWTVIAEPIERIWGFRTCSAEVLGILKSNGRVGVRWWD